MNNEIEQVYSEWKDVCFYGRSKDAIYSVDPKEFWSVLNWIDIDFFDETRGAPWKTRHEKLKAFCYAIVRTRKKLPPPDRQREWKQIEDRMFIDTVEAGWLGSSSSSTLNRRKGYVPCKLAEMPEEEIAAHLNTTRKAVENDGASFRRFARNNFEDPRT